ncbi:hypothetical protein SARC_10250 [Sphaeroforma arctica JP610]|uniref:Uncharacterized protein n=1 Tax=Sphaeroforma arctica JP610 TaxID=667725 RepID=A0A0L0FLB9_9EUKA|nr:hypothetical protein SARC_10250 [Sphaeroforma arctica JP610]KNC77286.1 hypothetical protein SARC_10250 [Sphaeroforma arctica JP610]|eukprot:XP_014151188.1 hypothetical protein SARC_10250 [Sphaeroforma arctica JP610]
MGAHRVIGDALERDSIGTTTDSGTESNLLGTDGSEDIKASAYRMFFDDSVSQFSVEEAFLALAGDKYLEMNLNDDH